MRSTMACASKLASVTASGVELRLVRAHVAGRAAGACAAGPRRPRWSVVTVTPQPLASNAPTGMRSNATLPKPSARVCVGPPLLASAPSARLALVTFCRSLACVKPQLVPLSML